MGWWKNWRERRLARKKKKLLGQPIRRGRGDTLDLLYTPTPLPNVDIPFVADAVPVAAHAASEWSGGGGDFSGGGASGTFDSGGDCGGGDSGGGDCGGGGGAD